MRAIIIVTLAMLAGCIVQKSPSPQSVQDNADAIGRASYADLVERMTETPLWRWCKPLMDSMNTMTYDTNLNAFYQFRHGDNFICQQAAVDVVARGHDVEDLRFVEMDVGRVDGELAGQPKTFTARQYCVSYHPHSDRDCWVKVDLAQTFAPTFECNDTGYCEQFKSERYTSSELPTFTDGTGYSNDPYPTPNSTEGDL